MEYRKHFYNTLFSNSSQKVHPANTLAEFTIQLAQSIDLGSRDNWEVGSREFSCPPSYPITVKPYELAGETNALVYCDLITQHFVGNDYVRCLRTFIHPIIYCDNAFQNVYYVSVEKRTFPDISMLITDVNGKITFREWRGASETGSTFSQRIKTLRHHLRPSFIIIDPLVVYYRKQTGRGREDIGPIYSIPPFVQRGHGICSVLAGLFRTLRFVLWSGAKSMGKETLKALGREALRTGGKILTDIAENPQAETQDIISKHVTNYTEHNQKVTWRQSQA